MDPWIAVSSVLFALLVAQWWLYRKDKALIRRAIAEFEVVKNWHEGEARRHA